MAAYYYAGTVCSRPITNLIEPQTTKININTSSSIHYISHYTARKKAISLWTESQMLSVVKIDRYSLIEQSRFIEIL